MTFSGHIAITALVLQASPNPWLVLPACFLLHLVADAIPHTEWQRLPEASKMAYTFMFGDILVTGTLVVTLFLLPVAPPWLTFLAILAGLLPDLTDGLARRHFKVFRHLHDMMHTIPHRPSNHLDWSKTFTGKLTMPTKIIMQIILISVAELSLLLH